MSSPWELFLLSKKTKKLINNLLKSIMNDSHIDQLIKDGHIKEAEKQSREIIKKWK